MNTRWNQSTMKANIRCILIHHPAIRQTGIAIACLVAPLFLAGCVAGGGVALTPPPAQVAPMSVADHDRFLHDTELQTALELEGRGDLAGAMQAYRVAADHGNPLATYQLANGYHFGDGVSRDFAEAAQLYHIAALAGYAVAQTDLADHYQRGTGVPRDLSLALAWYRLAAAQGEDTASARLAVRMVEGDGMPVDNAGAVKMFRHAADLPKEDPQAYHPNGESGGPGCQTGLGALYESGKAGLPQDFAQAAIWYQRAAENHMPVAEKHLAELYETGQGVEKNEAMAAMWRARAEKDAKNGPGSWTPL